MNVKIASQNTGVMSTPKAGGMLPFTSRKSGSDGHATIAHGNSFKLVSGYQDATTLHSCESKQERENCQAKQKEKQGEFGHQEDGQFAHAPFPFTISLSHTMANDMKFRKGPSTNAVGCTQASVSANIMADEVTEIAESIAVDASIIFSADCGVGIAVA